MKRSEARVHIKILVDSGRVAYTKHAKVRDPQQGKYPLTGEQVRTCLLKGSITEGPAQDIKEPNGWKLTVTRFKSDEKHEVVAVLIIDKKILVITGYGWN